MNSFWTECYRGIKRVARTLRRSLRAVLRTYVFKPRKGPTVCHGWVPPDLP